MGHALRGIWRALAAGGTLVDLRPVPSNCPIEIVTPERAVRVGEVDASGMAADDAAADHAAEEAVEQGWFALRGRTEFEFDFYWDSIQEMKSFIDESVRMKGVVPSVTDLERIYGELSESEQGGARVRCRRTTMLAVYEKPVTE